MLQPLQMTRAALQIADLDLLVRYSFSSTSHILFDRLLNATAQDTTSNRGFFTMVGRKLGLQ